MTSYQKLKAENRLLRKQLEIVSTKPNSHEANVILMKYKLSYDMENVLWLGNSSESGKIHGIIQKITTTKQK